MTHRYIAFTDRDPDDTILLKNHQRVTPHTTELAWLGWVLEFEPDDPNEASRSLDDDTLRPVTMSPDRQSITTASGLRWRRITD